MDLPRCKYGYATDPMLSGEWRQWSGMPDGSFDQCQRQDHSDSGGSWHFPESGGAVSKYGKRIDDPAKWQPMWQSIQEGEASDEYSLNRYLWPIVRDSGDRELQGWAEYYWPTPRMARTLLKLAEPGWHDPLPVGHLIKRKLVEEERPTELTPLGRKLAEILKGWDRA